MKQFDSMAATNRWPFKYIGTYSFDACKGEHRAKHLVDGEGKKVADDSVLLNYFGAPVDHGFFDNKVIAVSQSPNGSFYTVNDVMKYPLRRDQYVQIRRWEEFEESSLSSFEEYVARCWNDRKIVLTPRFKYRSDTILVASPDVNGRLYSGFHATSDGKVYECSVMSPDEVENTSEIFEATFDWSLTQDKILSPFFFIGPVDRVDGRLDVREFELDGEKFFFCMPNSRHGIPVQSFFSDRTFWKTFKGVSEVDLASILTKGPLRLDKLSEMTGHVGDNPYVVLSHCLEQNPSWDDYCLNMDGKSGEEVIGLRSKIQDADYWKGFDLLKNHSEWAYGILEGMDGNGYVLQNATIVCTGNPDLSTNLQTVVEDRQIRLFVPKDESPVLHSLCAAKRLDDGYDLIGGEDGVFSLQDYGQFIELADWSPSDRAGASAIAAAFKKYDVKSLTPKAAVDCPVTRHVLISFGDWAGHHGTVVAGFVYDPQTKKYIFEKLLANRLSVLLMANLWNCRGYACIVTKWFDCAFAADPNGSRFLCEDFWQPLPEEVSTNEKSLHKSQKYCTGQKDELAFIDTLKENAQWVGLRYQPRVLECFYTTLKIQERYGVMPVLVGPPGSGKSSLVGLYARVAKGDNLSQACKKIFVSASWNRPEDVIGWWNPVDGKYRSSGNGFYERLRDASNQKGKNFYFCFEEMNLAPIEHYFSDFMQLLSGIPGDDRILPNAPQDPENDPQKNLSLGPNVFLMGTLNKAPAAYALSERFIDRSATIFIEHPERGEHELDKCSGVQYDRIKSEGLPSNWKEWLIDLEKPLAKWGDEMKIVKLPDMPVPQGEPQESQTYELSSVNDAYNKILYYLKMVDLVPSYRTDVHVKAYLLNRPGSAGSIMDFQLMALDEAIAIFILPHRFNATAQQLDCLTDLFKEIFEEGSFCSRFIKRRREADKERNALFNL